MLLTGSEKNRTGTSLDVPYLVFTIGLKSVFYIVQIKEGWE